MFKKSVRFYIHSRVGNNFGTFQSFEHMPVHYQYNGNTAGIVDPVESYFLIRIFQCTG